VVCDSEHTDCWPDLQQWDMQFEQWSWLSCKVLIVY